MQMNNGNTVLRTSSILPKKEHDVCNCKLLFQLKRQLRIIPFQWIWARLVLSDVKGYKQVTHTGGLEGIVTQTTYIPELQLGIILTNQQSGAAFNAIKHYKDSYLDIDSEDYVKIYSNRIKANEESADKVTDEVWLPLHKTKKDKVKVDCFNYRNISGQMV
jgi:hypothetical protein